MPIALRIGTYENQLSKRNPRHANISRLRRLATQAFFCSGLIAAHAAEEFIETSASQSTSKWLRASGEQGVDAINDLNDPNGLLICFENPQMRGPGVCIFVRAFFYDVYH